MSDTIDLNGQNTLYEILDKSQADELIGLISESQVFKKKAKSLPPEEVIAYLYVVERLRFIGVRIITDPQADLQKEIDEYITYIFNKAVADQIIFKQILNNLNFNFAILEARVPFNDKTKKQFLELFEDVVDNYWLSRLTIYYDFAKDLALVISLIMSAEPQRNVISAFTTIFKAIGADYQRMQTVTRVQTIPAKKAKDVTLSLDYSFDKNKVNASYKLSNSNGQSIRVKELFQPGTLTFLTENVINLLARKSMKIDSGASVEMSDRAYKAIGSRHSDHIYKLNQAVRRHLEVVDGKKIKSFGQKGKSIIVYINIKLEKKTKDEQFGTKRNR